MSEALKTVAGLIAELEQYPQDAEVRSAKLTVATATLISKYDWSAARARKLNAMRAKYEEV